MCINSFYTKLPQQRTLIAKERKSIVVFKRTLVAWLSRMKERRHLVADTDTDTDTDAETDTDADSGRILLRFCWDSA